MELEVVTLSETNQTHKDKYCTFSLSSELQKADMKGTQRGQNTAQIA